MALRSIAQPMCFVCVCVLREKVKSSSHFANSSRRICQTDEWHFVWCLQKFLPHISFLIYLLNIHPNTLTPRVVCNLRGGKEICRMRYEKIDCRRLFGACKMCFVVDNKKVVHHREENCRKNMRNIFDDRQKGGNFLHDIHPSGIEWFSYLIENFVYMWCEECQKHL